MDPRWAQVVRGLLPRPEAELDLMLELAVGRVGILQVPSKIGAHYISATIFGVPTSLHLFTQTTIFF